jgi:hypothetical protein
MEKYVALLWLPLGKIVVCLRKWQIGENENELYMVGLFQGTEVSIFLQVFLEQNGLVAFVHCFKKV